MKIYGASSSLVEGTTFYRVTPDQIRRYYSDDDNIIVKYLVRNEGLQAFDIDQIYGSALIGSDAYICVNDGEPIEVDGEEVDPEDALELFDIEDLQEYIQDADDEIIRRYLSMYELDEFDLDSVAIELLSAGYSFVAIAQAAEDLERFDI